MLPPHSHAKQQLRCFASAAHQSKIKTASRETQSELQVFSDRQIKIKHNAGSHSQVTQRDRAVEVHIDQRGEVSIDFWKHFVHAGPGVRLFCIPKSGQGGVSGREALGAAESCVRHH